MAKLPTVQRLYVRGRDALRKRLEPHLPQMGLEFGLRAVAHKHTRAHCAASGQAAGAEVLG